MPPSRRPFVTVVSGVPRSGTSLMMRMIAEGGIEPLTDHERAADEDNPGGYFEFEPAKRVREDASWIAHADGRAVKVVHLLLRELPPEHEYRVVLMRRNMQEVLASQRVMLERRGATGGDLDDKKFAEIFTRQLDDLEQWAQGRPNLSLLAVHYNRLMEDPAGEIARIDAFLGGGLDTAAMAVPIDPTLYRQRR